MLTGKFGSEPSWVSICVGGRILIRIPETLFVVDSAIQSNASHFDSEREMMQRNNPLRRSNACSLSLLRLQGSVVLDRQKKGLFFPATDTIDPFSGFCPQGIEYSWSHVFLRTRNMRGIV